MRLYLFFFTSLTFDFFDVFLVTYVSVSVTTRQTDVLRFFFVTTRLDDPYDGPRDDTFS